MHVPITDFAPDMLGSVTVASLLHRLVEVEIKNSMQRQQQRITIFPLTLAELDAQLDAGRAGVADLPEPKRMDANKSKQVIGDAFTDGLILLFVDERRYTRLDETVEINPATQVMILRRTMLTG